MIARGLVVKKIRCPVTKAECPLHDMSSGGRHWCDDEGDPSTYEVCPRPKKAAKARKNSLARESERV